MSIITKIGIALPQHKIAQKDIQKFMVDLLEGDEIEKRKLNLMYARSGIENRYSVISDYGKEINQWEFFPQNKSLLPFPGLEKRMDIYKKSAADLGCKAVFDALDGDSLKDFTHLISVSCTGLSAPGLDIELVKKLGLPSDIHRTSVNFMGCYAAIHALKLAEAFCQSQNNAKVLVVLVELCTIHFQKENTLDFITSNLLFGDGAACCIIENKGTGYEIKNFYSKLYIENEHSMSWNVSSTGFLMGLKPDVPEVVENNMEEFVKTSLNKNGFEMDDIDNWVIHPGGKSILQATEKALRLNKKDLKPSYEILRQFGNMSSCTLIFVLKSLQSKAEQLSFLAGFGPGITMESMILKTTK